MRGIGSEVKVGLLVIIGILILAYFSLRIDSLPFFKKAQGGTIIAYFESVTGLDSQAPVKLAGIDVGKVESISLAGNKAKVVIRLNKGVVLRKGTEASLKTLGFLGEKYISLIPPQNKTETLEDGAVISESGPQADVDQILGQLHAIAEDVKAFTASVRTVFGGVEGTEGLQQIFDNFQVLSANIAESSKSLREIDTIVKNMEDISKNINMLVKNNREAITTTIKNFEAFSASLKDTLPEFTSQIEKLSQKLEGFIDENRDSVRTSLDNLKSASAKLETSLDSVTNISQKIESGEGTIGKLIYDEEAYDNVNETLQGVKNLVGKIDQFHTSVEFRGERQLEFNETKGYFGLRIQPRPERFYLIEIVDDPLGKLETTDRLIQTTDPVTGEIISTQRIIEQERKDVLKFSALFGHNFENLTLRIGLMESSFGLGTDYFLWDKRLRFSFDAFDFDGQADSDKPHLKFTARYNFHKNLFVQAGFDNFLNDDLRTAFLGGGIWFTDEDLKYLLGRVSLPSF